MASDTGNLGGGEEDDDDDDDDKVIRHFASLNSIWVIYWANHFST